jgi:hypothetical protein
LIYILVAAIVVIVVVIGVFMRRGGSRAGNAHSPPLAKVKSD